MSKNNGISIHDALTKRIATDTEKVSRVLDIVSRHVYRDDKVGVLARDVYFELTGEQIADNDVI